MKRSKRCRAAPPKASARASDTANRANSLLRPSAVAVDPSGDIWVAGGHDQVLEFNSNTRIRQAVRQKGSGEGQFNGIGGIASDASGDIYVTDSGNNRVEEFSPTGAYLRQFGSAGTGAGQFSDPTGIALDSSGNVWVLNTHGVLVQEFSPPAATSPASAPPDGSRAGGSGLAFSGGNLYVTEPLTRAGPGVLDRGRIARARSTNGARATASPRFRGASPQTRRAATCTSQTQAQTASRSSAPRGPSSPTFGSEGSGAGQFSAPEGVAVGSSGTVFIADTGNNRDRGMGGTKVVGEAPTYATSFGH